MRIKVRRGGWVGSHGKEGKVAGRVAGQGNPPSLGVQGMLLEGDICLTVPIWIKHKAPALFINSHVPVCRER